MIGYLLVVLATLLAVAVVWWFLGPEERARSSDAAWAREKAVEIEESKVSDPRDFASSGLDRLR